MTNRNTSGFKKRGKINFLAIAETGEIGLSQSDLALACGKHKTTIMRLVANLEGKRIKAPSESLSPFVGRKLTNQIKADDVANREVLIVYAIALCTAIIKHYAYKGSRKAQEVDTLLSRIGLTHYARCRSGEMPPEYAIASEVQDLTACILDIDPWVRLNDPKFCQLVFFWFGDRAYWEWVYNFLSIRERTHHNIVNPLVNGKRDFAIHRYLERPTKERLRSPVRDLVNLIDTSRDRKEFQARVRHLEGVDSLDLGARLMLAPWR